MCVGLSLGYSEIPLHLVERHALQERLHDRGGEKEVRFLWRARPSVLPVWWDGGVHVVRWGNRDRQEPIVLDVDDEDALVEALAQFLWAHREPANATE